MVKVILGAIVTGVVLFVWQYAAWMFLGVHHLDQDPLLRNEAAVIAALEGEQRGVYWIPGAKQDHDMESDEAKAWEEKHRRGPRGFLVFDPSGGEVMSGKTMGLGAGINILIGLALGLILHIAQIRRYVGRVMVVALVGVVVALSMDLANWNWQNFPDDWTRGFVVDHLVGFAIVGALLGLIVRPKTT